jgi:FixJ family two-component response regulator
MLPGEHEIIVVEDDSSMSQAIERLLAAAGWRVRMFATAEALLESGASEGASVLVFDIKLPGMSGLELHRKLLARGPVPPVIFMTAQEDWATLRDLANRAGAAAYFTKPFGGTELLQAIREQIPAA